MQPREKCNINPDILNNINFNQSLCGTCIINYGDYHNDFFGIRHDTYIDNHLVIEYRNQNPTYFPERQKELSLATVSQPDKKSASKRMSQILYELEVANTPLPEDNEDL